MNDLSANQPLRRLLSVRQLSKLYSWPLGGLRNLVFKAESNGLASAIVRVGRKVLIDEARFNLWIDALQAPQKNDRID